LSLLLGNAPGNDMKLSEEKIAGFRNFTNKLWNISRFVLLNIEGQKTKVELPELIFEADKSIVSELQLIIIEVTRHIENYNFSYAGEILSHFTWDKLADVYLEAVKSKEVGENKSIVLNYILNTLLKLWHPFMPFVTEVIWNEMYGSNHILMIEKWPQAIKELVKDNLIFDLITDRYIKFIKDERVSHKLKSDQKMNVWIFAPTKYEAFLQNRDYIKKSCGIDELIISKTEGDIKDSVGYKDKGENVSIFIDNKSLEQNFDKVAEGIRLETEKIEITSYILSLEKKLSNKEFIKNAPVTIVSGEQDKLKKAQEKLERINQQLASL
jgi:valyl-tRNA synthetase